MPVSIAYLLVVLVWATTPLATQWSDDSLSPFAALGSRMTLALLLGLFTAWVSRHPPLALRQHWRLYAAAALGIFPNLALVYTAARYIPSGLIAVMFGLSPFWVALLSSRVLGERALVARQYAALSLAIAGSLVIFAGRTTLGEQAGTGIVLMLVSNLCWSLSSVLIQRHASGATPLNQLNGSLLFALPGLWLGWWLFDGHWPVAISLKSAGSVLYLAVIGSLVGFVAYFYLLQKIRATTVALIPLMTPVLALLLGAAINHEAISLPVWVGSALIVAGLALFNGMAMNGRLLRR